MVDVVGDRRDIGIASRELGTPPSLGVGDGALFAQVGPDRIRIRDVIVVENVVVRGPIIDGIRR